MISVGIDVSKGKSTVCFFKPGGEVLVTPFEVAHTKGELNELADKINSYGEEVRVVLENTGYYHWSVVKVLVDHGIFVSAVNPLKMKRFCSQNIRKVKNDRIDAILSHPTVLPIGMSLSQYRAARTPTESYFCYPDNTTT